MLNNKENYWKIEVEQAKREIQNFIKDKSILINLDLSKQEDIYSSFDD